MRIIDRQYTEHPFLGVRHMTATLHAEGNAVNHKRAHRLMQILQIQAICARRSTRPAPPYKYANLLKTRQILYADQVWCSNITYLPMQGGFAYLIATMDWHSRYVQA